MKIDNLLTTDYIYIKYDNKSKILFKDGDYIYKNDILTDTNIYSTVSGKVLGITTINNNKYIVIENDYKDKTRKRRYTKKDINDYSKEDLINILKEYNIVDIDETSKILIVNGIDLYKEELTYNSLIKKYIINILDTIDALNNILNIKKCFFAVNNNDSDTILEIVNNIGSYPKIDLKLFNNDNLIGIKEVLIKKLTNYKNKNYKILYLNIIDIINIYNVLKKHIPITTTYITLTGDLIDYTKVLHVNIGTNIIDILREFKIDKVNNVIINGLLNGVLLKNPNYIIDKNIRSIFINSYKKYNESECINCGECINVCPVNINPKYMHFNKDKKSNEYRKKCIKCGMCSYICPSKINLYNGGLNE